MLRLVLTILSSVLVAVPRAQADEGFAGAAVPLFLAMASLHDQTAELLHLPCLREEGYEPLGKLADRVADLQTVAATETDSFVAEMQKPAPATGDSCSGSFTTLVTTVDEKRARTQRSLEKWTQIATQMQQASDLLLPAESIRFASTPAAGGGGGAKCIWKAKRLRKAMKQATSGLALQFKTVEASLQSTGEQFAIYREQNSALAANCGQAVPPDPDPAQTTHARARLASGARVAAGNAANRVSQVTGSASGEGLMTGPQIGKENAPEFKTAEVAALHAAMEKQAASDNSAEALTGFSGADRLQTTASTGDQGSADTHADGSFQSLREVLHDAIADSNKRPEASRAADATRAPASATGATEAGSTLPDAGAPNLFQRVHACYQRTGR